jgi:hypothetical protein
VYIHIAGSFIAYDDSGEIVETVEVHPDGTPDWSHASICDHRGIGGASGYRDLESALKAGESNASLVLAPNDIVRVASEFARGA